MAEWLALTAKKVPTLKLFICVITKLKIKKC